MNPASEAGKAERAYVGGAGGRESWVARFIALRYWDAANRAAAEFLVDDQGRARMAARSAPRSDTTCHLGLANRREG
jgi:hypothetical protein